MPGQRTQYRRGQGNGAQLPLDFAYGHVQPQALEVEKAVLGALMIDRDAYMEVCEVLHIESFYEPRNQKIYAAIQQLSMELQIQMKFIMEFLFKDVKIIVKLILIVMIIEQ